MKNQKNLFAEERRERIHKLIETHQKIIVPEMCDMFGVSASTIRNDLRALEESGLIKRTHGGAIRTSKMSFESNPMLNKVRMLKEKKAIGKKAAELVEDGDIIAIDTGTTPFEFAKHLIEKDNLTIVLNDITIASYLEEHSNATVILLGGTIRRGYHYTYSRDYINFLNEINLDKAFITCNALSITKGATTPDINLAEMKRDIIQISSEAVLLCDSSKIDRVSFAKIASISAFDYIITDNGIESEDLKKIESMDTNILVVKR